MRDLVDRFELCFGLDLLRDVLPGGSIEVVRSGGGWSLRTGGYREVAYLRRSDGWTSDMVECITVVLQKHEDLLFGRVHLIVDDLKSAKPETLAGAQP